MRKIRIEQKSVRSLTPLQPYMKLETRFRFAFPLDEVSSDLATRIGIPENVAEGTAFVPGILGPISSFNANGRSEPLKDRPKISVPRMVYTSWEDWHGQSHSGVQYRYYDQWQKRQIMPPEELFCFQKVDDVPSLVSAPLNFTSEHEQQIIHTMNLFLEIFGSVFLATIDGKAMPAPFIKRVNWLLLPKGERPWPKVKALLEERLETGENPADAGVVLERMTYLSKFDPASYAIGEGGFSGYFAIEFPRKSVWLLESQHLDNATYLFGQNWDAFSKFTKKDIIAGQLCRQRIIHDRRWQRTIREALS